MAMYEGQSVEVLGTDLDGFLGSMYQAEVVVVINRTHYKVKYYTINNNDSTGKLRERVHIGRLRPNPPEEYVQAFKVGDEVDCYLREGYWFGVVTKCHINPRSYTIHFPMTGDDELVYHNDVRPHFDWINGSFEGQPQFQFML